MKLRHILLSCTLLLAGEAQASTLEQALRDTLSKLAAATDQERYRGAREAYAIVTNDLHAPIAPLHDAYDEALELTEELLAVEQHSPSHVRWYVVATLKKISDRPMYLAVTQRAWAALRQARVRLAQIIADPNESSAIKSAATN